MARLNSFYLDTHEWPSEIGGAAVLRGAEAKHLLTVLRSEQGQTVRLFDGAGREGLFTLQESKRNQALLTLLEDHHHEPSKNGLHLSIGWGKSKRRNYLFEKAVELQAAGVSFWQARRSQGQVPDSPKDSWKEKCTQAAKQCGNVFLPDLHTCPKGIAELKGLAHNFDECYLAWESEEASTLLAPEMLANRNCMIVIGPEGGFDQSEAKELVAAGFIPVTLGNSILRWETAAIHCLSLGFYARQK